MNIAVKGALFNALLFPGWGEIFLKKYTRGLCIITATMAGILSILWSVIQTTIAILKVSPFKKGTVTFSSIVQLAIESVKALDFYYLFLLLFLIISLWIISIIDAYILGKVEMAKSSTPFDQQSVSPQV
ncbi:MAG: hypothetical protein JW976_15905 [Syntrophaceae bacterium]|nr:hypothetical protein [Syntrophaceae bacterium]